MAQIDISLLGTATNIIIFMLVFVGGWGVLQVANPFKDAGKSLYGLLAFLVAIVVVMSRQMVSVITFATPWFILLGLVGFFFIFFAKMFGSADSSITNAWEGRGVGWLIFFVSLIVIFALGNSFGQDLLSKTQPGQPTQSVVPVETLPDGTVIVQDTGSVAGPGTNSNDFGQNLVLTLFHPKILGVMFLFLMGTLTILMLNMGVKAGGSGGGGGGGHH